MKFHDERWRNSKLSHLFMFKAEDDDGLIFKLKENWYGAG